MGARGQTPVLQFHFNWKTLSAGVTLWNFYFQIFEQAIKSEQIIEFLKHLLRYINGDILLIGIGPQPIAACSPSPTAPDYRILETQSQFNIRAGIDLDND